MTTPPVSSAGRSNRRRRHLERFGAILPLALLSAFAGCANVHNVEVGAIPDDYRTRHPIVVSQAETAIDLPITASEARLTLSARSRVEEFAARFKGSGADTMRVMLPYGSVNQGAAQAVSNDVVAILHRNGVERSRIIVVPYQAIGDQGATPIRLAFDTLVAKTGPCGRWPDDLGDTSENKEYYNFGCASQQNLAAQIADPRDLLGPRGMDTIDAGRRNTVLDNYRNGKKTVSEPTETESDYTWSR
ncbi:CpaD family pilus assembly lipoprotein [Aurantimonas sp. VKM B-3413]|uniref:CpaD family pilus assembly protein n=1 Tax=Aurantimonas sp. VKM B-3413 TaxID=2779401 RepID=UPI001E375F8F|nr:CpaD family pilus assembly lipoprotein [Aurantimonas sp. VKM B-3413]